MKRILVVAVAAILAWGGFTFFSNHAGAEATAAAIDIMIMLRFAT